MANTKTRKKEMCHKITGVQIGSDGDQTFAQDVPTSVQDMHTSAQDVPVSVENVQTSNDSLMHSISVENPAEIRVVTNAPETEPKITAASPLNTTPTSAGATVYHINLSGSSNVTFNFG